MNSPTNPQAKRHIGQILIDQGILTEDQLRIALLEQMKSHLPVGRLLVQLGFVSEATLRDALSEKLGLQPVDLAHIIVDPAALKMVPRDMARRYRVFPVALDRQAKKFIVALADTNNIVAIDQLRAHLKGEYEVELRLAGDSEVDRAIEQYYGHEFSIDGILREIETGEVDYATITEGDEYSQPVVRLISALLADAVERSASDIHFEPEQNFLRIRYRIDGVLRQIRSLHKTYWPAMAVRLKVMSKMNIAETRAPQDGRISATMSGRVVDFRVSSLPTTHGENVVLRILDRQKGIVPLDKLGLDEIQLDLLKRMIARPEGIILVTGPTGSGKTTTLYSILNHINSDAINIMTLEDPVEYPMTLIRQTSVAEAAKLDFANGIRALMRQDPDAILVGRNPGRRHSGNGVPRVDDRPPGLLHPSHQLGRGRLSAPVGHRDRARHHGGQHHWDRCTTARPQALPHMPAGLRARRAGAPAPRAWPVGFDNALPGRRLRAVRLPGL